MAHRRYRQVSGRVLPNFNTPQDQFAPRTNLNTLDGSRKSHGSRLASRVASGPITKTSLFSSYGDDSDDDFEVASSHIRTGKPRKRQFPSLSVKMGSENSSRDSNRMNLSPRPQLHDRGKRRKLDLEKERLEKEKSKLFGNTSMTGLCRVCIHSVLLLSPKETFNNACRAQQVL